MFQLFRNFSLFHKFICKVVKESIFSLQKVLVRLVIKYFNTVPAYCIIADYPDTVLQTQNWDKDRSKGKCRCLCLGDILYSIPCRDIYFVCFKLLELTSVVLLYNISGLLAKCNLFILMRQQHVIFVVGSVKRYQSVKTGFLTVQSHEEQELNVKVLCYVSLISPECPFISSQPEHLILDTYVYSYTTVCTYG